MKLVIFYDFSGSAPSNGMIRQNDTQMIKWLVVNGMASSVYHIIIGDIPEPVYNSIPGTHSQVIPWKTDILGSFKLWNWPMYLRMLKLVLVANYLRSVGGIEWWKEGTQTWIYPIHSNIFQSGVYIYIWHANASIYLGQTSWEVRGLPWLILCFATAVALFPSGLPMYIHSMHMHRG